MKKITLLISTLFFCEQLLSMATIFITQQEIAVYEAIRSIADALKSRLDDGQSVDYFTQNVGQDDETPLDLSSGLILSVRVDKNRQGDYKSFNLLTPWGRVPLERSERYFSDQAADNLFNLISSCSILDNKRMICSENSVYLLFDIMCCNNKALPRIDCFSQSDVIIRRAELAYLNAGHALQWQLLQSIYQVRRTRSAENNNRMVNSMSQLGLNN